MKIVVTGSKGMLAGDLIPRLERSGFPVAGFDMPGHDITRPEELRRDLEAEHPDMVINCAAYTAVDRAETEQEAAFRVNRDGAASCADACSRLGIPLIHISTDFVFDGSLDRPYRENDATGPLSIYGRSKCEGEEAVRAGLTEHIIVRSAWLFGVHGGNFVKTILRNAREGKELRVVDDQTGCPTWAGDLAYALTGIALFVRTRPGESPWGTYHFCGAGQTTWCGFARAVIEEAGRYEQLAVCSVQPITSDMYPAPARRPSWSVLDTGKISGVFGIEPLEWREGLKAMLGELYCC
ncbi:dTDP-4-dehydrorhamnose reductase [bacterium]|nr:dTDP-4-dehydrorhamnose reductase [bacterium]